MSSRQIARTFLEDGTRAAMRATRESVRDWLTEADTSPDGPTIPTRRGYEYGIPRGGTNSAYQTGGIGGTSRQQTLEQMNSAYLACVWAGACVDAIARAVTAGGLVIRPNLEADEDKALPSNVQRLSRLLRFTNDRENLVQLCRSTITDLWVCGDAFIEQTFLFSEPVALYTLDAASMFVDADEHGQILSYTQKMGNKDKVIFEPDEVIHLSLDAPRGGLYGVPPLLKCDIPMTTWLFAAADLQEQMRAGNPGRIHVDLPKDNPSAIERWLQRYVGNNLGAKGVTRPITTTRGGVINEIGVANVATLLETMRNNRDEIVSLLGVPPQKVQIVETGNLGGGTGEAQDKTWRMGLIVPAQSLFLEAFNFTVVQKGFGITTHHVAFEEIDYRDSKLIEDIRDQRLRNGSWTLNRYRRDLGEQKVDGGDDAVIQVRTGLVFWKDMAIYTRAEMAALSAAAIVAGVDASFLLPGATTADPADPAADPVPPGESSAVDLVEAAVAQRGMEARIAKGARSPDAEMAALATSWNRAYQHRRKEALKQLPAPGATER